MTYGQRCNSVGEGKNGSFTPSRFTNGPPSWILMDQFPLTTIYTVPKTVRDTATAPGDYGYVFFVIKMPLFLFPLPFLHSFSTFLSLEKSISILEKPFNYPSPALFYSFIIRGTLKNTRKHYKPCFCFILIIIPR